MSACYHTNQIQCDNCRSRWREEMQRQIQPPPMIYPTLPLIPSPPKVVNVCQHCFCGELSVNGKAHVQCCMCQTRKLK